MAIPLPVRFLPIVAMAITPALNAQVPWSDGPLPGLPTMYSVDQNTNLASPDRAAEGYSKPPGFAGATPAPMVVAGGPDFSAAAILRKCVSENNERCGILKGPLPEIDCFSLGLDVLPTTPEGKVKVGPNRWVGITYSVAAGATGAKGSRIAVEGGANGNGADMFNYVYKGSVCLPPEMIGTTFRGWDSEEAGLPAILKPEVDALDCYASIYELGLAAELGLSPNPFYFFSVSSATIKYIPTGWWKPSTVKNQSQSGAAIFVTQWDSKRRVWSCPKELYSPEEIGLKTCEDVDALAIDGQKRHMMFSTRYAGRCVKRNQLLFTDLSTDAAAAVTVTYEDNVPVTDGLGVADGDDIDALCGLDPTCNNAPNRLQIERLFGYANGKSPRLPFPKLDVQAYRRRTGRVEFYQINMLGGMPGQVAVLMASPPDGFGRGVFFTIGAAVVPRGPFLGNPIRPLVMPVPVGLSKVSLELTFLSFFGQAPYQLKVSTPLCLQL